MGYAYFIINDGNVGCSRQWHSGNPPDVLAQLCSHFQPAVSRQGPEDGINQIALQKNLNKMKASDDRVSSEASLDSGHPLYLS